MPADGVIIVTPELLNQLRADLGPKLEVRGGEWDAIAGRLEAVGGRWTCNACPVQAEGEIGGHGWYFRARYETWSFSVSEPGGDHDAAVDVSCGFASGWHIEEEWGDEGYAAGWMPPAVALGFILDCLAAFKAGTLPRVGDDDAR